MDPQENSDRNDAFFSSIPVISSACRHAYVCTRGEHWVILTNQFNGRYLRLAEPVWDAVSELQGTRTLRVWFEKHESLLGRETLIDALFSMQRMKLIGGLNGLPDSAPAKRLFNPLFCRFTLGDPSAIINAVAHFTSFLNARSVALSFTVMMSLALLVLVRQWTDIYDQWQLLLEQRSWVYYLFLYPFVKLFHELAHGVVLRRLGGHVTQAGVSFFVFVPLPFVDASEAWSLSRRKYRIWVTSAGIVSDLFIAATGLILWSLFQPGAVSEAAFCLFIIGVFSSILFNANPLLKFDGYYLLEDALDSPGLYRRAQFYYCFLLKRYLLCLDRVSAPVVHRGERPWLLGYGALSTAYRLLLVFLISFFLITQFQWLGVGLSAFAWGPMVLKPLLNTGRYLLRSPETGQYRRRSVLIAGSVATILLITITAIPVPLSTRTVGMLWVPEQAQIYAGEPGELADIYVQSGQYVATGQPLFRIYSPELQVEISRARSELNQLELQSREHQADGAAPAVSEQQIRYLKQKLRLLESRSERLTVRANTAGRIAYDSYSLAPGIRLERGALMSHVVDSNALIVKAFVDQAALGQVKQGVTLASVRLARHISESLPVELTAHTPAGSHPVSARQLLSQRYGEVAAIESVDPDHSMQQLFELELTLKDRLLSLPGDVAIGSTAYVTLRHGSEPLVYRWWRRSRQILIRQQQV